MSHLKRAPLADSGTFPTTGSAGGSLLDRATRLAMECRSCLGEGARDDAREQYVVLLRVLRALSVLPLTEAETLELRGLRAQRDALHTELQSTRWRSGVHGAV